MAVDLTSLVADFLTPQLVARIAAAVGINPALAQTLIDAAVPAIIGAMGTAANSPVAAKKISDAVSNADPDLLTKLSSSLGAGRMDVASGGTGVLGDILGGSSLSGLAGALAQFAGVTPAAAQTAAGAAGQAIVGVIGQQDPSTWSDAASMKAFLASQKDVVDAALPSGLSSILSRSGVVAGVTGAAASASAAASSAASATRATINSVTPPRPRSSLPLWLLVVIAIVVIAAIYFYLSSRRETAPAATGATQIELALESAPQNL